MTLRYGSLFSGVGGLEMGVQAVLGGQTVWHCETDPAASLVLARHWPDAPNLGDVTAVDWTGVEPVDVITGGFPCQDVSLAGRRAGMIRDGEGRTRSGLWGQMLRAIDTLRPSLVVAENVRGILSARADSDVEPCPWCLGDAGDTEPAVRALGAVLADLAGVGYDAWWTGLRAADVGAPHGRFRVFIFAWPAQDTDGATCGERWGATPGQAQGGWARPNTGRRGLPPATDADRGGHGQQQDAPRVGRVDSPHEAGTRQRERPRSITVDRGAPTAPDADGDGLGRAGRVEPGQRDADGRGHPNGHGPRPEPETWGVYADAVHRWATILDRPAPPPTEPAPRGGRRLNARLAEWLMGYPDGHIVDTPGITRNAALRCAGNGVVPQQAAAATRAWAAWARHSTCCS